MAKDGWAWYKSHYILGNLVSIPNNQPSVSSPLFDSIIKENPFQVSLTFLTHLILDKVISPSLIASSYAKIK